MNTCFVCALLMLSASDLLAGDPRFLNNGFVIPDEGYCDQPYVVVLPDGAWLCTLTTGPGEEGSPEQHVVATRSLDEGRTWSPLINIEPPGPPESSWVMPMVTDYGRVYAFFLHNTDNLREVIAANDYARKRVDTLGHYMYRYSDDGGLTWSERFEIPIREFDIDRANPYGGTVRFFWGVGKPLAHNGVAWIGLSKVGSFGAGFIERSEGFFLRSDNILSEPDPAKLHWETLPNGDTGLRAPIGPIAEEQNLTWLESGALYCTYRTVEGHPCHAYSQDGGYTWTPPEYMAYTPGGRLLKHPRAANFVRRLANGRYLYWFHNHGGNSYQGRNPAWLSAGKEIEGRIHWSQPEIVLYAEDPDLRMSYPDFIETKQGVYITETQKSVARVHRVDDQLLAALFAQGESATVARTGLVGEFESVPDGLLSLENSASEEAASGLTVEVAFTLPEDFTATALFTVQARTGASLLSAHLSSEGSLQMQCTEGEPPGETYETYAGILKAGEPHHLVVLLDYRARVLSVLLDGALLDGGAAASQGWFRLPDMSSTPAPTDVEAMNTPGAVHLLRVYNRCLSTSEAAGNYRAYAAAASKK